jgi:phosphoribosyl 1,2-cyclic phosphate phosphodiesterase
MEITFLGTSASPSMPIPFCACPVCTLARTKRGKNLRKRSSIAINDDLLVDIGPDTASSSFEYQISLANISVCLQTHSHEDHFDPEMIIARHRDYGTVVNSDLLVLGSQETLRAMDLIIGRRCSYGSLFDPKVQAAFRIQLLAVSPFRTYTIGSYQVAGLPANHGSNRGCLLYSIQHGNKSVLYATDTSIIFEDVWKHLERARMHYDVIILDHTYGMGYESKPGDHLAAQDFIEHVDRFIASNILKTSGQVLATHLSHEGIMEHAKLDDFARKHNYTIAYDGLHITLAE